MSVANLTRKLVLLLLIVLFSSISFRIYAASRGLHEGTDGATSQYVSFGDWLGKPITHRVVFIDWSSWSSLANPYFLGTTKAWLSEGINNYETITVPLLIKGDSPRMLSLVASGYYDSYFRTLAQKLSRTGAPQRIIIRLGWEPNGKWYPWSAVPSPANYINAYRHVVHVMRSQCNVLKFEYNLSLIGYKNFDWTRAYPGDDVVDIVSMDVYDQYVNGWNDVLNGYEGLAFLRAFARNHNKQEAYPEWGLSTTIYGHGDDPGFIQNMYNWVKAGGSAVAYQAYWDSFSGGPNAVLYGYGSGLVPKSASLYRYLFSH